MQVQTENGAVPAAVREFSRSGTARDLLQLPIEQAGQSSSEVSFADLPVPIMRLAPDGRILEANRLAMKLIENFDAG